MSVYVTFSVYTRVCVYIYIARRVNIYGDARFNYIYLYFDLYTYKHMVKYIVTISH